ncbi:MAG TPA: hypothetical protein GXX51_06170 [Firmicutes bacterium]|nr:hypothetical protein [Bacillota bacterium]
MDVSINDSVLAVVTVGKEKVAGQAPIFYARDEAEMERIAIYISRITGGIVHDLENGVYIIVKH